MKKIYQVLILLLITNVSFGQEKTDAMLFGDVKSKKSQEHIPYATITVKGTRLGTVCDGSGHFKMSNLPIGKYVIVAQSLGYKSQEKEIVLEKGKSVQLFFELDDDLMNLEQVVITGTRTEHYVKDAAVRTEVITFKEIENKNAGNLYQALEGTPGVRVENQCQYCNFTMVRLQGLGAEHTQVLIDGQPVYSGLAGVYGLEQMSTVDVGQIEVVKGAGSALFGSSAVAGAINIVTKEPSMQPSTQIGVQIGSYNTNKYDISSSLRNEKGNIGLSVFAQKQTGNAIDQTGAGLTLDEVKKKDGISDRVANNLTNAGFALFFDNAFLKNDKLIIKGKSVFEKRQGGTMTDDYYKNPLTDGTEGIVTDRYETQLSYQKKWNENSVINFNIAFVNHNRDATNDSYLGDYMSTHGDSTPDVRDMRPYLAKENSFTSTLTYGRTIKKHSFLVGIQSFFDQLEESGMYVVVDTLSPFIGTSYKSIGNKQAREFGAFLQDEWKISPRLVIVPGVRIDNHNSGEEYTTNKQVSLLSSFPKTAFNETNVNPRLAIKYDITKQISMRANVGTGFRAPYGFSEDLHLCSGSPRVWKSSDLNPETSISYNISSDYYGEQLRLSINAFRTELTDKIGFTDADADVAALGYDYQWKNIDDAFVQGIELSIQSNLTQKMGMGIDFTYNQGEYKKKREDWIGTAYEDLSKYISRFPATTGNLKVEYKPKTWSIVLTGSYQGNMYIDYYNEEIDPVLGDQTKIKKTDPFMIFNVRVSKDINPFKLYAGVNNLFNYIQDEKHLDDAAFMYAPVYGTMFYGGISININH